LVEVVGHHQAVLIRKDLGQEGAYGSSDTSDSVDLTDQESEVNDANSSANAADDQADGLTNLDRVETEECTSDSGCIDESEAAAEQPEPTRDDYLDAIKQVAESTDSVVKETDMRDQSQYSVNEISSEFGSWQEALDAADIDNETRLLNELHRVADELGHRPSTTEMNKYGHVSATMYADYFETYTEAADRAFSNDSSATETGYDEERTFATVTEIHQDRRIPQPVAVRILEITDESGNKKQASLVVEDFEGARCQLNVWRKHNVDATWEPDRWYVLEELRGKHWIDNNGNSHRQLSSTRDLQVTYAGDDRPRGSIADDSIDDTTRPDQHEEMDTAVSKTHDDSDSSTSDGILAEIESDFELE
jgi:hypothetical protein